eukprot:4970519-Pyramimonas_sp.AAC.1
MINTVFTIVDVDVIPRPSRSPFHIDLPSGICSEMNTTVAASVASNQLAVVRTSVRGLARPRRCANVHHAFVAI